MLADEVLMFQVMRSQQDMAWVQSHKVNVAIQNFENLLQEPSLAESDESISSCSLSFCQPEHAWYSTYFFMITGLFSPNIKQDATPVKKSKNCK